MQKISVVGFRLSMILAVGAFTFVGCEGNNPPPKSTVPASGSHDHGHDHDHDHGHDHSAHGHDHDHAHAHKGPHDGSLVEVGDEEYHLEWTFDDSTGKVVIYVIDSTAKKEVPIEAGELIVTVKIGDMTMDYKLAAVGATGEPAKSFQFEAIDKTLIEGLKTGGLGVETKTKLTIGGKQFDVEFKQDAHAK